MKQHTGTFVSCIVLLLCPLFVLAQQGGKFADQSQDPQMPFTITRYGTMHGLPQNQVIDIVAKKNGNLILSTANGIAEYNGTEFTPFIQNEVFQEKFHMRLYWHEKTGRLYGKELRDVLNLVYPTMLQTARLYGTHLDGDTLFGIDAFGRLFKKAVTEKRFRLVGKTGARNCFAFYAEKGRYYFSNEQRTYVFDERTQRTDVLATEATLRFRRNPFSGRLYGVSYRERYVYEIGNGTEVRRISVSHPAMKEGLLLTDIAFTDAGNWFISSSQGLLQVSNGKTILYGSQSHFPALFLECLYYDRQQGCLFIGTGAHGMLKLQMKSCRSFFDSPGIGESSNGSITRDSRGTIFIAGSGGILFKKDNRGISEYRRFPFLIGCMSVLDDVLYIGTWGHGVRMLRDGREIDSIPRGRLNNNSVHAIFRDSHGTIWMGLGHGIAKGKNAASVKPVYPAIDESIITFYERRDGTICIGGMEHVIFISPDGKKIRMLGREHGITGKETRSFYEDRRGRLWIGTYGGGVYRYYRNRIVSVNRKPGCYLGPDAFTLAPDGFGNLLMTSNKGLWMVSERKLNAFCDGRISYLIPFYFGEESGIWNTEFNGGMLNNYLRTAPGTFYFPSIQGVVQKTPEKLPYRKLRTEFSSISINDTVHPFGNHWLERSTHTIRFDFFCANYATRFNLHYQYKLNGPGLPDTWSRMQKSGSVSFKMLPPGNYVFSVRAIDGFNDGSPAERSYAFEILPYFYETTWFQVLLTIFLLFGIAGLLRYRYFRSLQKESRENKINNTILELKLKAIQSKMDPHFIFNALNNIIYLLNDGKYQEAEELVHDFSLLLRRFLEKSDETFLSLKEELGIIDLYLLIEQKRYNRQFTYEIAIDAGLEEQKIPTLLIQPLVENAIKHGISHTDRPCFIRVKAAKTPSGLTISIEDDGIGLEKSGVINRNRKNHASKGLKLVKDKIAIMHEKYGIAIRLEVLDRSSEGTTGTVSRLTIDIQ